MFNRDASRELIERYKKEKMPENLVRCREAEKKTAVFLKDYPVDRLQSLPMDEYLIAKEGYGNPHSFCRRLRYEMAVTCSMGNAWPNVFGIYLKNGTEISLSPTYGKMFGDNYAKAYSYILEEITEILKAVPQENYDPVMRSDLNSSFLYKLITVYYPERFIPVCSKDRLERYCDCVGIPFDSEAEMIYNNLRLWEWKDSVPEIADWPNWLAMTFFEWLMANNYRIDGNSLKGDPDFRATVCGRPDIYEC